MNGVLLAGAQPWPAGRQGDARMSAAKFTKRDLKKKREKKKRKKKKEKILKKERERKKERRERGGGGRKEMEETRGRKVWQKCACVCVRARACNR